MMASNHLVSLKQGRNRGFSEFSYNRQEEPRIVKNSIVGETQSLSDEDESRHKEIVEGVNNGNGGGNDPPVHGSSVGKPEPQPQQQPPFQVVHWERFLPLGSLKVLLVENDDSTRQLVSALLRNCSYEVIPAANGLEAWKILDDLTNHVDIVLAEVVMPSLSGFGLLCRIMSHKTFKNIPVIMMSSHDSMGIVFKCLSKGAVDFLVKPIRKNELKNLWQHVWRRCHSSSGSGSESGIQTQKSVKSKSVDESEDNTGSNDEDDNGSIGLNGRDGSDNGSGTQSSWTKRAEEPDSPQPLSSWDQLADPRDSTCVQVIHLKTETFCNNWVPLSGTKVCQEKKESDDEGMGKDLEIGVPRNPDIQLESYPSEKVSTSLTSQVMEKLSDNNLKISNQQPNGGLLGLNGSNATGGLSTQAADLIGTIANSTKPQVPTTSNEAPSSVPTVSKDKYKGIARGKELPSVELSLKRLRSIGEVGMAAHDDRNILRHSDLSAFSRYNTSATSTQPPTGYGGSCSSSFDNSSDAMKLESTYNMHSNSNATPLNHGSNGSSNNHGMDSTTKNVFIKPEAFAEKVSPTSTSKRFNPPSAFHSVRHGNCAAQQITQENVDSVAVTETVEQPREPHHQVQVQHHHHHYHHHHHHVHNMQQQMQPPSNHDEMSLKSMADDALQCGSSNVLGEPIEGNARNYSVNGSISGSNHGSNGSSTVHPGTMNMESDNGLAGKSGVGGCSGSVSGSGNGSDQNRFSQREAALTKFRQKRKERCFEKKVRYHSRKKLAEQRPRVRGQFVRQITNENTSHDADF